MHHETGRNTTAQDKAPFVPGDIHSNRLKPGGRIKQPFALYALLLVPPSWILGSVEAECGCTLACIARRNAAARVAPERYACARFCPTECERERERESRITCENVCQYLRRMVKVHDIVKAVRFQFFTRSKE